LCASRLYAVIATFLIGATIPALAAGSQAERTNQYVREDLRRFHALVDLYREGITSGIADLLALPVERLLKMVERAATERDPMSPWQIVRFKAAAMLHTDTGLTRLQDDVDRTFLHIDIASRLLMKGGPELRAFTSGWYCSLARLLRDSGELPMAIRVLELGRTRLADDAPILHDSGILYEWMATGRSVDGLEIEKAGPMSAADSALARLNGRRAGYLREAAAHFKNSAAAYAADPRNAGTTPWLTRMHAARVDMLVGRDEDALKVLRQLTASAADEGTTYLALLFTGAIHERARNLDEAVRAYEQAIASFPHGHTGYIALSQALQRSGRGDESRTILSRLVGDPGVRRREPWWWYFFDPSEIVTARIEALRKDARR
jgi:tetratricopeptide (TPR) repeat protein